MNKPNVELLSTVIDEIENDVFLWNQHEWVSSPLMRSPAEDTACGTAYCVAGRIASKSGRTPVYEKFEYAPEDSGKFRRSLYFVATESDIESGNYTRSVSDGLRRFYVAKGNRFVRLGENIKVISAEDAAIEDLQIQGVLIEDEYSVMLDRTPMSDELFFSGNTLDDIKNVKEKLAAIEES